jgi:hypothetical protein
MEFATRKRSGEQVWTRSATAASVIDRVPLSCRSASLCGPSSGNAKLQPSSDAIGPFYKDRLARWEFARDYFREGLDGRDSTEDMETITLSVEKSLLDEAQRVAEAQQTTRDAVLNEWLARLALGAERVET